MKISIICPIYNGEKYIENLDKSIRAQENVELESIKYILTESRDNSENMLKRIGADYRRIKPVEFSHSLTREKEALASKGDIIVFISQDIIIRDNYWLSNLTRDIIAGRCDAAFSRQVCENNSIEKYVRNKNYPDESRIVSRSDVESMGLKAFFFSDVSSAIRKDVYVKLNGYDHVNLITNEDMYFAYKLIMNGYRIKYCADSVVTHSHTFTYRQLYSRYFDTGVFFAGNSYLDEFGTSSSGLSLAKYVFINALKDKNVKAAVNVIPNFAARYIGMKMGRRYKRLSRRTISRYSLNKYYWQSI